MESARFTTSSSRSARSARSARRWGVLVLLPALSACMSMYNRTAADDAQRYAAVVASPLRTDQDHKTDAERHPTDFLAFTGVAPGMRVLDVSSGGGYTSQLLAVAVGPGGIVYAQTQRPGATLTKRLEDHPQANLVITTQPFEQLVTDDTPKLDLVTLVQNYHDISYMSVDRNKMNRRIFDALKPGGHYIVIDHSARTGTGIADGKTLHRIDEAVVLAEVRQAGFVLEREGNFLRNPADARDQSSGDSKIPTDKFALKFVKP